MIIYEVARWSEFIKWYKGGYGKGERENNFVMECRGENDVLK